MINKFLDYFKGYNITVDDFNFIISKLEILEVKKNTIIQHRKAVCNKIYFINKGLIRSYYSNARGEEKTKCVYTSGRFITDYKAFINREPATLTIQALQPSNLAALSYNDLQIIYQKIPEFNKFGRIMVEQILIATIEELRMLHEHESPLNRYEVFIKNHAAIAYKIPQRFIADMINVSPVHLSRIKSGYAKNRNVQTDKS